MRHETAARAIAITTLLGVVGWSTAAWATPSGSGELPPPSAFKIRVTTPLGGWLFVRSGRGTNLGGITVIGASVAF